MSMSILGIIASHNYIAVNKILIQELGLAEATILGEIAGEYEYWESKNELDNDGYFYSTIENVYSATGLTAHQQRMALNNLAQVGIVQMKRKGMPSKRYLKINEDAVVKIFNNKSLKKLTTSCKKIEQQDVKKLNTNKNKGININNNNKEYIYMGEYKNVFFTQEQLDKLKEIPYWDKWIEKLDSYMQSTGKKYKDCLATIRNWARKEKDEINTRKRITGNDRNIQNLNSFYDN